MRARLLWVLVAMITPTAGCGLTLDYAPPEDAGRDAGSALFDIGVPRDAGPAIDGGGDDAQPDDGNVAVADAAIACTDSSECGTGSTCVRGCDGAAGRCVPDGAPCAAVAVCGCDGVTYSSACEAHLAGIELGDPAVCFGCGPLGVPCGAGEICLGCPDAPPACMPDLPTGPPCRLQPFCGCDGSTYISDCAARAAGVARISDGPCPGDCLTTADCSDGSYCARAACGDDVGQCMPLPTTFRPLVCGCSGRLYRSETAALRQEGIIGPCDVCPTPSTSCCLDTADCPHNSTCVGAIGCTIGGNCAPIGTFGDSQCWDDADCGPGFVCYGAFLCARCTGMMCGPVADTPGSCVPAGP